MKFSREISVQHASRSSGVTQPASGFELRAPIEGLVRRVRILPGIGAALCALLLVTGCITRVPDGVRAVKNLEYGQPDRHPLKLDLYLPENPVGKLPVIVWIHGGSWKSGSKDFCPIAFMAHKGLAIVSLDYRLSTVATYPAQLHDCKGAIRWLRANAAKYQLDPDRLGIFGASAGGHLAALLATTGTVKQLEGNVGGNLEYSSDVQAVCAFYPPTDLDKLVTNPEWRRSPISDIGRLLGGPLNDNLQKAATANPINYISPKTAPIFLLHGDRDTLVPISQSEILYNALQKAGVASEFAIVKGKGHGIIAPPDVAPRIYQFYQQHLRIDRSLAN